jgi:hypothetical protein
MSENDEKLSDEQKWKLLELYRQVLEKWDNGEICLYQVKELLGNKFLEIADSE